MENTSQEKFPLTDIKVKLIGEDGNAFSIIGRVTKALPRKSCCQTKRRKASWARPKGRSSPC